MKKQKKIKFSNILHWIKNNKFTILLVSVFIAGIFLRVYQMDTKYPFGWDQVDNAWTAKRLIVQHEYPLVGMVAKQNSGIYIGPLYYYFISIFYFLANLNPIASEYIALTTSIFTFWVIYYFTKKLFNREVAIIAVTLNTFSYLAFIFDGVQWPVNFIPSISLIIFFLLYKIMQGDVKKIVYLALSVGLIFNIHFTAIFFPLIVLLCLPFFPRKWETLRYILISIPIFLVFLIPNTIYMFSKKLYSSNSFYLASYYHGFHLKRMFQITNDAFIQFINYLTLPILDNLRAFVLPVFLIVYSYDKKINEKFKFLYLTVLYFLIPWIIFTTYSGETSDYYFAINRFVCLFIIAYFLHRIWDLKFVLGKIAVAIILVYYSVYNINNILNYHDIGSLNNRIERVEKEIKLGHQIGYQEGIPESYIYYYLMKKKGIIVY